MLLNTEKVVSNINYIKGDLFHAPKGSILIHATNCCGIWGGGIAKIFAQKFPESYKIYREYCKNNIVGGTALGTCLLIKPENDYRVACLFTSKGYGKFVDSPEEILEATKYAVFDLIYQNNDVKEFHACKFNSGLFRVPWEKTEAVLEATGKKFTVYEY
jgi:ADP-ribose 1''-phosphate phosphatase